MKRMIVLTGIISILMLNSGVFAHDGLWDINLNTWTGDLLGHDDKDPWKARPTLTVTNTMTVDDWGNFHFEIYDFGTYDVIFTEGDGLYSMWVGDSSSTTEYTDYIYNINSNQRTVHFCFYNNPVEPTDTVTFKVYTDNTAQENTWFGLTVYPTPTSTPVPEPVTIALLGMGALLLRRRVKR